MDCFEISKATWRAGYREELDTAAPDPKDAYAPAGMERKIQRRTHARLGHIPQ